MKRSYTILVDDNMSEEELKKILSKNNISLADGNDLPEPTDGKELAELLREIASQGGLKSFGDASEWQREERKDRKLPFRED